MNKDRKIVFGILALLVSIVALSIAYAGFTQNLNINGTGNITATSWDVHFANLTNGVRSGTTIEQTAPTIKSGNTTIGDYSVKFFTPGDSITYTFDVVNEGDYDAKIAVLTKGTPSCSGSDATSNTNVCANLEYTLTYTTGGDSVAVNDTLEVGETKNMTLVLRYKNTISQYDLPTAEVTVGNLGITIQYSQDSNAGGSSQTGSGSNVAATDVSCFTYTTSNNEVTITEYSDECTKDVVIPATIESMPVTVIDDSSFSNKQLTSVSIPNTVTTIDSYAFYNNLLTEITIPSGVTYIDAEAFGNNYITSVYIPNNVVTLYAGDSFPVFDHNPLTTVYVDMTDISEFAFIFAPIESLTIGENVRTIGDYAFSNNHLTSVTIPSGVTSIGYGAFEFNNLTSVTIQGKSSPSDFDLYGDSIWEFFDEENIVWTGNN